MLRAFLSGRAAAKVVVGACVAVLWVGGCSDSHPPAARLAEGCTINSDCNAPLVCAFQRCHTACETSRDCTNGERCVASDRPFHVCQLDIETKCNANSDCPQGQVCGVDGQCRDACTTSRDCVKGQVCVSGTCADPDELHDGALVSEGGDSGEPVSGLPCSFNSDCPATLLCRAGTCAPECQTTTDCAPGLTCDNSRCLVPLACAVGDAGDDPRAGGPCLYSSQCPTPLTCVHGYCSCECLAAEDCAPGFACVSSRCQAVVGGANSVEIGPHGGTITSSDGKLSMKIPEGAIDSSIVFAVKAATAWPSGAVGEVYEVEPSGTHFTKPATIALSYAGIDLGAESAADLFVGTAVGASWQSLGTAINDTHAQTVASTTNHLSVFGLVFFGNGRVTDAGVGTIQGGSSGIAGSGTAGNPGIGGRNDGSGNSTGVGAQGGTTSSQGGAPNGGFGQPGGRGGSAGAQLGAGGFAIGAGGFAVGAGGLAAAGRTGTAGSVGSGGFAGGAGAGGFTSNGGTFSGGSTSNGGTFAGGTAGFGGAGTGGSCAGGCACSTAGDCPGTVPLVCCYLAAKQSSACDSSAACKASGGTLLP